MTVYSACHILNNHVAVTTPFLSNSMASHVALQGLSTQLMSKLETKFQAAESWVWINVAAWFHTSLHYAFARHFLATLHQSSPCNESSEHIVMWLVFRTCVHVSVVCRVSPWNGIGPRAHTPNISAVNYNKSQGNPRGLATGILQNTSVV